MANTYIPLAAAAHARIDWSRGRLVGTCVPGDGQAAFDVVHLLLDGQDVLTAVANQSAFALGVELAGLPLPAREHAAFEFRIPHRRLLPGQLAQDSVRLEVATSDGEVFFRHDLQGARELLALVDGAPADLLWDVRFTGVRDGAVFGTLSDRHGLGRRPALTVRLNEHPAEPLAVHGSSADSRTHQFSVPLRADRLTSGPNVLTLLGDAEQPVASFAMQMGPATPGDSERRLAALEAQVAFLKRLVLGQFADPLPAKLGLLKSEVVQICSEMLTLQRTNFERELAGLRAAAATASDVATDTAGAPAASTTPAAAAAAASTPATPL